MLIGEHSSILSTFIKLPFVIKIFVLSIFLSDRLRQVLLYSSNHLPQSLHSCTIVSSEVGIHIMNPDPSARAPGLGWRSKTRTPLKSTTEFWIKFLLIELLFFK